jgi:transcriptional regulator of acetoin/glycerol metabolism
MCGCDDLVRPEHLPETIVPVRSCDPRTAPPLSRLESIERDHVLRVIAECETLGEAAATLGIDVSTLWRKRKRYERECPS